MATTTNYGWTTPDDTALVKDGASAIRTLGSSVDTTTKNLNPETTLGDLSFRSSTSNVNTRLGIGSSGQHLTVVAGVPAWATASDQTPLTTKGDLFTFSTLDARLGVGTNTHVLTADSSEATGLKWAAPSSGAMTKITTATFASTTSVSVDGCFTSTYANYVAYLTFTGDSAAANIDLRMRVGGVDDTAGYSTQAIFANGSTPDAGEDLGGTGLMRIGEHLEYTNGTKIEFYQPEIAKSTSITAYSQSHKTSGGNSAYLTAGIHVDSTQFDGFKLSFGTQSGTVRVYGLEN